MFVIPSGTRHQVTSSGRVVTLWALFSATQGRERGEPLSNRQARGSSKHMTTAPWTECERHITHRGEKGDAF